MATYVLIHGAGSDSWYWHLVAPQLQELGHTVIAPDLPVTDESAGLKDYADVVVAAIGEATELILVAQSMGGFTAPLVAARVPVELIVYVAAMIPAPGESPGQWWANTGAPAPGADFDPFVTFLHDVDPSLYAEGALHNFPQADKPFEAPWPLDAMPTVPFEVLIATHDRLFPADFQRRVTKERLGVDPDEIDSGHLPALAKPDDLVRRLEGYRLAHSL